ncbi:MAG: hypothetical protein ABI811_04350 [Acidobacteriota bacterium]
MNRFALCILITAGALCAQPPAVPAKAKPVEAPWTKKTPWGDPDLGGVFQQRFLDKNNRPVIGLDLADFVDIPYQPWSKEKYDFNQTGKGQSQDPESACLPAGVPRSTGLPYPLRMLQTPGLITILYEGNVHTYRLILMDKQHPKDVNPTWMGHSIGHWEGNTLIVDTVGFNDKAWLDPGGHIHTDQLHTVEHYTRLTENRLQYEFTIDDPGAYTKPWGWSYVLEGHQDWEIMEYVCNENNKDIEHMIQGNK